MCFKYLDNLSFIFIKLSLLKLSDIKIKFEIGFAKEKISLLSKIIFFSFSFDI